MSLPASPFTFFADPASQLGTTIFAPTPGLVINFPPTETQNYGTVPKSVEESALGERIPVVYGRVQVPGRPVYIGLTGTTTKTMHIVYVLCEGEIQEVETSTALFDGIAAPAAVTVEAYTGTMTQSVCSLKDYDANFNDPMIGTAYVYARYVPANVPDFTGVPSLLVTIKGLKIYDPRAATTAYSTNTALCLADIFNRKRFNNYTVDIDWDSVDDAADHCDDTVGTAPNTETRFTFNYAFSEMSMEQAITLIRVHFLGAITIDNGKFSIKCNKTGASVAFFTDSDIVRGSLKIHPIYNNDRINKVTFSWTDPDKWVAVEESIENPRIVSDGDEIIEASYDLTGYQTHSMALRTATYLVNIGNNDLNVSFITYNSKGIQPLDIFTLTHQIGITSKLMVCTKVALLENGDYKIEASEYDPACFSDSVITEPTYPDTTFPKSSDVPDDVTALTLAEELEQLKDSTWISNIRVSYTPSVFAFIRHYEIWVSRDGGSYYLEGITTGASYLIRAVTELSTYSVKVITVSRWDVDSAGTTQNVIPLGKYANPVWKTGAAITAIESGDIVYLSWAMSDNSAPAEDIDIVGYEIRRGKTTDSWESGAYIISVDALGFLDKNCPPGEWRYFIKAKDSVGNYTDTAKSVDVTVTLNPYGSFQNSWELDLDTSTGTNIGVGMGYVLPVSASYDTLGERFPGAALGAGVGGNTLLGLAVAPTTAQATSTYIDLGQEITGRWTVSYESTKLGTSTASLTVNIGMSTNSSDWTNYNAGSVFTATGRYVRANLQFGSDASAIYTVWEPFEVAVSLNPREHYGTYDVNSTNGIAVSFSSGFSSIEKITLTNLTTIGVHLSADSVSTAGCTLRAFSAAGLPTTCSSAVARVEGY